MSDSDEVDAPPCRTSKPTYSLWDHQSPSATSVFPSRADYSPNSQRRQVHLPLSIPSQLERNSRTAQLPGKRTLLTSTHLISANSTTGSAEQEKMLLPRHLADRARTSKPPRSPQDGSLTHQVLALKRRIREAVHGKKGSPKERSSTIKQRLQQKLQRAQPPLPDNPPPDNCYSGESDEGSEYELANEACTCPVHGRSLGPTDV